MKRNLSNKAFFILATVAVSLAVSSGVSVSAQTAAKTQQVRVVNTESEPLPVKVLPGPSSRKPFQLRMFVGPKGNGNDVSHFMIPAGKRVVIENVSAISRIPVGLKAEVSFFTYIDSNDDGVGDSQDITFHRIPLIDQGNFDGVAISMANIKTLVFGDGTIGASQFSIGLQGRLNGLTTEFTQIQVTFSGYIEDLPVQ
jgi:hypothetical protein